MNLEHCSGHQARHRVDWPRIRFPRLFNTMSDREDVYGDGSFQLVIPHTPTAAAVCSWRPWSARGERMKHVAEPKSSRREAKRAPAPTGHITNRDMEAFVGGMLWGPAADVIEQHILHCDECVLLGFYIDACVEADEIDAAIGEPS